MGDSPFFGPQTVPDRSATHNSAKVYSLFFAEKNYLTDFN